ncbi:MAG TPA: FkbM family methyltransferase [Methyloceanibacter sp.]|nr:FkbM family methyltransferase [Methyloceanibacter sp.]
MKLAALYFADRYPHARIFSLEPNPGNFALLQKNVQHNPRITPIQACLTGRPDQTVFISTAGRTSHFQTNTSGHGAEVPGVSVEQLCLDQNVDRIDLLKLDIEGAEKDVLVHPAFLDRVDVIAAELHGDYDLASFSGDIAPYGLRAQRETLADGSDLVLAYRPGIESVLH